LNASSGARVLAETLPSSSTGAANLSLSAAPSGYYFLKPCDARNNCGASTLIFSGAINVRLMGALLIQGANLTFSWNTSGVTLPLSFSVWDYAEEVSTAVGFSSSVSGTASFAPPAIFKPGNYSFNACDSFSLQTEDGADDDGYYADDSSSGAASRRHHHFRRSLSEGPPITPSSVRSQQHQHPFRASRRAHKPQPLPVPRKLSFRRSAPVQQHAAHENGDPANFHVQRALSANDEPALLAALEDRGRVLGALLSSGDVAAAIELARGAPRTRGTFSHAARSLLQDEWTSAVVDVRTLRGLPSRKSNNTRAPHFVYLTFPNGRHARVHPASVAFARLPPVGSVPVQGFFFRNEFVADRTGAECEEPAASGRRVVCVVGGTAREFASPAAAEAEVAALRRTGARRLQMGADPAVAPVQPVFDATYSTGARSILFLNVRFKNQISSDDSICDITSVNDAAAILPLRHGARSFGAVTFLPTVVNCTLELKLSAAEYLSLYDFHKLAKDALAAARAATSCSPLSAAQIADFDHIAIFHPEFGIGSDGDFDYGGLGEIPGRISWYNGPTNANEGFVAHEVGHNYGVQHASTWPAGGEFVEYGDQVDVMGSSPNMLIGDYSAGSKISIGWIPSDRFIALHPHGGDAASGLVSNASFLLGAFDRNSAIGVNPFPTYPEKVALAARLTIPPHSVIVGSKLGAAAFDKQDAMFAFLQFRAMALIPGVYMSEFALGDHGMSNPTLICNEPLCREQAPLAGANDAFVFDRDGTRALIEVGALSPGVIPATPGVSNTARQNSAYQVTVSYLGANGRKLGAALPAGCCTTTGLCATDVITRVTAAGVFARSMSTSTPVALFHVTSPSDGMIFIDACNSGTPPLSAPIGVSAFLSGFPTAHAFHTGSVGVSGDAVCKFSSNPAK
jgi:hypothetical protein